MRQRLFSRPIIRVSVALILLAGSTVQTFAANLKLEAKLIWGTDDAKSPNPEHKEVDAATKEKLSQLYARWEELTRT